MTVSDDIFQLIKSLSQTEKTYFKKFAQLHVLGNENVYLRLFDAIDAQEKYNEKLLTDVFSKGKSSSQFSVLKNYLSNLILKSLRNYHADITVRAELRQQLQNASLLFERGLHAQADKLLRRCRKVAEQCELFRELIEISGQEQTMLLFGKVYDASTIKVMNEMLDERKLVLQKMQNTYDYDKLEYNLSHLLQTKKSLNDAAKLMRSNLLKNEKSAWSVVSLLKFHHIHATFFYYTGKLKECIAHQQKEISVLEEHPEILQLRLQDYVLLTNNVLLLLLQFSDFKKFDLQLAQFRKKISVQNVSVRLWEQAIAHNWLMEMERWYADFNYHKIISVSENLKQQLKNNKAELNLADQFVFIDLLSRASFKAKKYSEALSYSVELLNHPDAAKKFQHYNDARLFNLCIHFELGNFDLLDYQIQSFQRQTMKKEKDNARYSSVISFLKKFPSAIDRKQKQKILVKSIEEIPNSSYFNFKEWIKNKL